MITAEQIVRVFHTKEGDVRALDGVDVRVEEGEFFVLLGPSGSGKTTLLRSVAGLETPDSGEIHLGSECVFSSTKRIVVPPESRGIGMVFQSYAIWPHMTVFDNVGLPLKWGKMKIDRKDVAARVNKALSLVGLAELAHRPAPLLSGGQQQRVALARALAVEPKVLLMDEPLSNLDARLREEVRSEIRTLVKQMGLTVLYVTHDQDEAMDLADRVAVMHLGKILQLGAPEELYKRPNDPRVAQFFGEMNWIPGEVVEAGVVQASFGKVKAGTKDFSAGSKVQIGLRPEDVELTDTGVTTSDGNTFEGMIEQSTFMGDRRAYVVKIGSDLVSVYGDPDQHYTGKATVHLSPDSVHCFSPTAVQQVADIEDTEAMAVG